MLVSLESVFLGKINAQSSYYLDHPAMKLQPIIFLSSLQASPALVPNYLWKVI